uniref:NADH-ubiquinone oxidoreductase chain 4L n=1 Tax=Ghauriana sinensis TaxID=2729071 RepID=A0A6M3R9W5_9HEMI|nr:NADH dehydrogenase subunit 4L [Ghauriana sinensis]
MKLLKLMNLIFLIMYMMSMMSLILIRKHILMCLMSFEFIVISLLLISMNYCLNFNYSMYIYLMMMTFYVCEGVMGLGILVRMIRSHGNDYLNSMFMW